MASFNYDAYAAQQEARKSTNPNSGLGPEVRFVSDFLKNDGDVIVVRFPYHSMADLVFETTHAITFPGKRFPSRVRCEGDNCPFCAQGIKMDIRFFVKMLVYGIDETTSEVRIFNGIWDRPSAFADIDIKNLMQEYGDISNYLFKIKRNGTGTATRYTMSIVMNNTVYNPAVYKADFTELTKVDPVKILSKSVAQYNEALNPGTASKQTTTDQTQPYTQTVHIPFEGDVSIQKQQPKATVPTPVAGNTPAVSKQESTVETPVEQRRTTTRYQF